MDANDTQRNRYNSDAAAINRRFYKIRRRHEANVFNAHFKDIEPITEEDIKQRVKRASVFFDLPVPDMIDRCETLAKITFSNFSELGSEIAYDIEKLRRIGINNPDAFDAMLTHELSHQFLADYCFSFCKCYAWSMELACDFMVGVRCSASYIASGKYKYAVSQMKASVSHPDGSFRIKAVEAGFDFAERLHRKGKRLFIGYALPGITRFLCVNSQALNEAYHRFLTALSPPPQKERNIMDYPDSNLIKQYLLKHGIGKKDDKNELK